MSFSSWWIRKKFKIDWRYISQTGSCYKEGTEIFAIEIEYLLSQIFMGHDENP